MQRQRITTMKRLAVMMAGLVLSGAALADPLPLSINVGNSANDRSGDGLRTAFTKTMQAVNALNAMRGQPSGLAVLDGSGRLVVGQVPSELSPAKFSLQGVAPLDLSLSTRNGVAPLEYHNPNVIRLGGGNQVSICPSGSCLDGVSDGSPSNDHHRTSALFSATTQDDAHSQENTLSVITTMNKGFAPQWSGSTAYAAGANVRRGAEIYRAAGACTSGTTGPSGLALSGITDGSCQWGWINAGAINAKVGLYVETDVIPGAGPSWGAAFNYHFKNDPSIAGNFWPGVEFDYANDSGKDCVIGVADCTSIRVGIAGNAQITHGMQITGDGFVRGGQQRKSMLWGLRLNGDNSVERAGLELDIQSQVGIGFGASGIGTARFSQAAIRDVSITPTSLDLSGQYTNAISIAGTVSGAQIVGTGFVVYPDGGLQAKNFNANGTPGVSCSGPPTANFQVTNGIVTRC